MTQLDHFESAFAAASKDVFHLHEPSLRKVCIVTDLDADDAAAFADKVKRFLDVLHVKGDVDWRVLGKADYDDVGQLLEMVLDDKPDLICTYRNLNNDEFAFPYSLGAYLNVLVRLSKPPVLVLPHPRKEKGYSWTEINTDRVMVVTDHLTGDERLVNWGVHFTEDKGTLYLSHVEDDATLQRYLDVIAKIPQLSSDVANEKLKAQLLKEPTDYIRSCQKVIQDAGVPLTVEAVVRTGHTVADHRHLVEEREVDLLVLRSHDDAHEVAMHGVAYTLTVELTGLPMLLL